PWASVIAPRPSSGAGWNGRRRKRSCAPWRPPRSTAPMTGRTGAVSTPGTGHAIAGAMSAVINVALPVFAIILAGYGSGKLGLLGQASSEALNKFVYWIALPPLLFLAMARAPVAETLNWPFL